jgi:hypothetical protein
VLVSACRHLLQLLLSLLLALVLLVLLLALLLLLLLLLLLVPAFQQGLLMQWLVQQLQLIGYQ